MKYILNKKNFLFLLIILIFLSFFVFDLDNFFTINYFKQHYQFIENYTKENFLISLLFFYSFFLILLFFFLPVSTFMLICSGFLFAPHICIPLSILIITIGGTLNFFMLKKITFLSILSKASTWVDKIDKNFKNNEIQFLLLLRLIPMPFIIQNAMTVILNVSLKFFFFTTLFGIIPYGVIYSLAGLQLKKIISSHDSISISNILNYENFFFIILLIIFILITIFLKKKYY